MTSGLTSESSLAETYASNPEPTTPVCITYYWQVFRAKATEAKLTVSDWPESGPPAAPFGQEQARLECMNQQFATHQRLARWGNALTPDARLANVPPWLPTS